MNHSARIGCTVAECRYHSTNDNYCTKDKIQVVKHSANTTSIECTDCASFEKC